jgi:hypothetical protein
MLLIAENKVFSEVQILTLEEVGRQQEIEASPPSVASQILHHSHDYNFIYCKGGAHVIG